MEKKRVALLIHSMKSGGAERTVSVLVNGLKDFFDFYIVMFEEGVGYKLPENQSVHVLSRSLDSTSSIKNLLSLHPWAYKYHKYCKKNKIELSVSFLNRACYVNIMAKTIYGSTYKAIVCERTHQMSALSHFSGINLFLTRTLIRRYYNKADLILTNSKQIKIDLRKDFGLRPPIKVIYNALDIPGIQALAKEPVDFKFDSSFFYFISVAGFRIEKNHSVLVAAMAKLRHLPVKLVLVGNGAFENKTRALVERSKLGENVLFVPHQQNPFKYVNGSGCFVLSSNVEGMPNALLEALACSKPVISTDCLTGPREILAPDTDPAARINEGYELAKYGVLCAEKSEDAMAAAMTRIFEDAPLRQQYIQLAPERIADFDTSIIFDQFHEVFDNI